MVTWTFEGQQVNTPLHIRNRVMGGDEVTPALRYSILNLGGRNYEPRTQSLEFGGYGYNPAVREAVAAGVPVSVTPVQALQSLGTPINEIRAATHGKRDSAGPIPVVQLPGSSGLGGGHPVFAGGAPSGLVPSMDPDPDGGAPSAGFGDVLLIGGVVLVAVLVLGRKK